MANPQIRANPLQLAKLVAKAATKTGVRATARVLDRPPSSVSDMLKEPTRMTVEEFDALLRVHGVHLFASWSKN